MTKVLNETDKLAFIITQYGLDRIAEAIADTTVEINLSKIKIGDANFKYYTPNKNQEELVHPIPDGSFYIISKELLEDGLTVSLYTIFSENIENCEIREIGIYETVDGVDHLFAISTQQPLLKPLKSLRYFISVDYYAFLKSQNLASIYDRIIIDADHAPVTEEDYDNLMSTILFSESNLMEQINGNTRVIGLNRARQLEDKVNEVKTNFSYSSTYSTLSTLLNFINPENLFAYWTFDYNRKNSAINAITDISKNMRNLSSSTSLSLMKRTYEGLMPFLNYSSPNYFYLDQGVQTVRFNNALFVIHGIPNIDDGFISGTSFSDYVTVKSTNIPNTSDWDLTFNFSFTEPEVEGIGDGLTFNILNFGTPYSLNAYLEVTTTTESDETEIHNTLYVQIGNGIAWQTTLSYELPENSHLIKIKYSGGTYSLEEFIEGEYITKVSSSSLSEITNTTGIITIGRISNTLNFNAIESMDLKEFSISSEENVVINGTVYQNYNDLTLLDDSRTSDISFSMGFVIEPLATENSRTILARSNYAAQSFIFEIVEKPDNTLEIKLFSDKNNYLLFKSGLNSIPTTKHSLIFSYSYITKNITAYVNGKLLELVKTEVGNYTHMNASLTTLYKFSCTPDPTIWADSASTPTTLYDSNGEVVTQGGKYNIVTEGTDTFVTIDNNECEPNSSKDFIISAYYGWIFIRGAIEHGPVYTTTLEITSETKLYSGVGVLYSGNEWGINKNSNGDYVVTYLNEEATNQTGDLESQTFYAWSYNQPTQEIYTNSVATPTLFYTLDGDLYTGDKWTIDDNYNIYYDGYPATYISPENLPYIPLTSYVIGNNGLPAQLIDSKVGVIFIIKEALNETQMRSLSLMLDATMGDNPCIE